MTTSIVSFLAVLTIFVVYTNAWVTSDQYITRIEDEEQYKQFIIDNKFSLVFFVDKSKRSKEFTPECFKLSGILHDSEPDVKMAWVDIQKYPDIGRKYSIPTMPGIVFLREERPSIYPYTSKDLTDVSEKVIPWLLKKKGTLVKTIKSTKIAKLITEPLKISLIAFFRNTNSREFRAIKHTAYDTTNIGFYTIQDQSIWSEYKIYKESLVLFNSETWQSFTFDGPYDIDSIKNFIHTFALKDIVEWEQKYTYIFNQVRDADFVVVFFPRNKQRLKGLEELAKPKRGKIVFIYVDTIHAAAVSAPFKTLKMPVENYTETFRYVKVEENIGLQQYKPKDESVTVDNIKAFIEQMEKGDVEPHKVSQAVPDGWNDKPMKTLVRDTFIEVIGDKTKSRFVEFYAPWCGHCKKLSPIWQELAEKYEDNKDVVIGAIDATSNDLDIKIGGYPTLQFYPKGADEPVQFDGERTLEGLSSFIEKYAKSEKDEL
ncbi:unnamed protein product [Owenia fusiformis]|uniref:protein disulfide-isomerase n=1 Tax=Owenia fusiformis TaxID=6347 RepID=A0A8J1UHS4_OWEFU|nr:unnamed protein product [Owenia fusiformis]